MNTTHNQTKSSHMYSESSIGCKIVQKFRGKMFSKYRTSRSGGHPVIDARDDNWYIKFTLTGLAEYLTHKYFH